MRRSVGYCEPNFAIAGEEKTWKFIYTTASSLPKGTKLKFDLLSSDRHFEWQPPKTAQKEKENLIWGEMPDGKALPAKKVGSENSFEYEFVLPEEIKTGDSFVIQLGSPSKDSKKAGNSAQKHTQRRRPFHLYIDPKGKGSYTTPETFHMDVRGNVLKNIRIIVPSIIMRNKRFDVIVRFEDEFGNLTSNAPENTLVELRYDHFRETLNWKLFVPETGFITLPNLYFNEPGIYRIQLHNLLSKEVFHSPPIKCFPDKEESLFWGSLHGESEKVDSTENIEACIRYFRDDSAYQFFASSNFEHEAQVTQKIWKIISQQISEFNEEDRFVGFLGFHWVGEVGEEGVRLFVTAKDNKAFFQQKDSKSNCLKKIYKTNPSKEWLSIPCFTMAKDCLYDFKNFQPEFERVVEIYNAWGSSECLEKEGNLYPIKGSGKNSISEKAEGSILNALKQNCRFGFVAGGHDDRGVYQNLYDANQKQYTPGLTAILAKNHNRNSLFEALKQRSCYATTGARMILGLYVAQSPMGSELNTHTKPGLEFNRHISGYIVGTDEIQEVILIRNGKVLKKFHPEKDHFEFAFDDAENLSSATLSGNNPFVFYYMRVLQKDGHTGWSSPIWVDLLPSKKNELKKVKKK